MRAIIYARVSTEEQKRKGYSIEAQIEACRAYAKAKGWEVVTVFKEAKRFQSQHGAILTGAEKPRGNDFRSGFQSQHGAILTNFRRII